MPLKKVPFTDARESLSYLIDQVQKTGQPIAITRHGKPAAVLMHMEALEEKLNKHEKKQWMLRGSGAWLGNEGVDEAVRDIRRQFGESHDKRIKKLKRELSEK